MPLRLSKLNKPGGASMADHGQTRCNLPSREEGRHCLPPKTPKKDLSLRRAISETHKDVDKIVEDFQQQPMKGGHEPEMVQCDGCGVSEECTPTYISRIKRLYCGKWVCGLCSEAVKETVKKNPAVSIREALELHMTLCTEFNRTVRINPKLSFASSMRDIARRSSQKRTSNDFCASRIARTSSCGARIALKVEESPFR